MVHKYNYMQESTELRHVTASYTQWDKKMD